ncbi:MAG: PIN domain-containing protein [Alphaproteobacteria bacterium]
MRVLLDSSILINAYRDTQDHHEPSFDLLIQQKKTTSFTAAHCFAETYSTLSRLPPGHRVSPDQVLLYLKDISERLTLITLDESEYVAAISNAASMGIAGGAIYDALIAQCALKAKAQVIYTWNVKHFARLGPEIAKRVREPG